MTLFATDGLVRTTIDRQLSVAFTKRGSLATVSKRFGNIAFIDTTFHCPGTQTTVCPASQKTRLQGWAVKGLDDFSEQCPKRFHFVQVARKEGQPGLQKH